MLQWVKEMTRIRRTGWSISQKWEREHLEQLNSTQVLTWKAILSYQENEHRWNWSAIQENFIRGESLIQWLHFLIRLLYFSSFCEFDLSSILMMTFLPYGERNTIKRLEDFIQWRSNEIFLLLETLTRKTLAISCGKVSRRKKPKHPNLRT